MAKSKPAVFQVTRKGLAVWIGLVFFIAAWMFILGVLVGRGTAPVRFDTHNLEQELAALKDAVIKKQQARMEEQTAGDDLNKRELGFYEALKANAPVTDLVPKAAPPSGDNENAPAVSSAKPLPKNATPSAVKPKKTANAALKPKPVKKPPARSTKHRAAGVRGGRFTVQVASVQDIESAGRMVDQLNAKGFDAFFIRAEIAGKGIWYRVRVGRYKTRQQADAMVARLKRSHMAAMAIAAN